jgi:anti-sigma regulatory factor (Ser/Thr protein kinase)
VPSTSWTFPADGSNVAPVRQSVADFASANGVPDSLVRDVRIAVSEAVTNAVVHAFRGIGDDGTIIVAVTVREREWIDVSVTDNGSGMAPRDDSPGLGLGLPLIRHLADQFDHRRPSEGVGTELWMRFMFTEPAREDCRRDGSSPGTLRRLRETVDDSEST